MFAYDYIIASYNAKTSIIGHNNIKLCCRKDCLMNAVKVTRHRITKWRIRNKRVEKKNKQ